MSHKFENITFNELPMAIAHLIAEVETLKAMVQTGVNCTEDADKWFNLEELRAYLPDKPAKQTVYGWVSQHQIPYHKKGKKLQFLKSEIDEWMKSDKRKTAAEIHAEAIAYVNRKAGYEKFKK
jgi:excisionase family DNA binding protein